DLAMPQLVDQLSGLATKAKVVLDSITPAAPVYGAGYVSVPLDIKVEGHFFAVNKFLQLVRSQVSLAPTTVTANGRLLDISSVQLDQSEPAPTVTADVKMAAYYFSPGSSAPQPATTTSSASGG
ncbi:MAG TPA: type 4a pilus biogenesis protein PilO, partial [Gaiellaceae bacterium]|nr:type 4a pilus biogenesis protein PilO [Gaiellaceae bacterium]